MPHIKCTCDHCNSCGKCKGVFDCTWRERCVCRGQVGLCVCCSTCVECKKCDDGSKESCKEKDKCSCSYYCEDCNDEHTK